MQVLEFWLIGVTNEEFLFAEVLTVEEGRELWVKIARYAGVQFDQFKIKSLAGEVLYTGNFITDAC